MNRLGGKFGQGLLGNPPISSSFSPHDQNRFHGGETSFGGNQDSYFGDGGGYTRDMGERKVRSSNDSFYGDIDMRGNSFRDQNSGSMGFGDGDRNINRGDRNLGHDRDFRNDEDYYLGRNQMRTGRQDRLSGGGNYSDDRGRGDQFNNRLGMGTVSPSVMNKGQGILGSGPPGGGDTDFRTQGVYGGMGNQSRGGNMQGVGNIALSPPNIGGQTMRQQSGGMGLQMAGMEANLLTLQKQQQQQEALLRDTQLQMVNNLLLQQQNKRGSQMSPGFGGPGLLGTPQNLPPTMIGGGGGGQRGAGNIPSLLDINTKKPQGKRGFNGPRDQGGFKKQRMTSQKRTPDRRYDNSSNRGQRRHSPDRQRSSEGADSRSSTPHRKESDDAKGIPARGQHMAKPHPSNTEKQPPTTPEVTPQSSSASFVQMAKPKQANLTEKYDPEEPTEDEILEFEGDKETIEVIDIADEPKLSSTLEPVEDIEDVMIVTMEKNQEEQEEKPKEKIDSSKKMTNFYCHVCSTECRNAEGFAKHMNGVKHKNRMDALMGLHMEKSNQLISRIKAEEHLRKIESSPRDEDRRRSDGDRRRSREGRDRHRPFSGPFRRRAAFHQTDGRSRRERHQSSDQEFPDIGDLVTLDTIGYEEESTDRDKDVAEMKKTEKEKSEKTAQSDQLTAEVKTDQSEVLKDISSLEGTKEKPQVTSRKQLDTPALPSEVPENVQSIPQAKKEEGDKFSTKDESPKTGNKKTPKQAATPGTAKKKTAEKSKDGEIIRSPEVSEVAINNEKKNDSAGKEKVSKEVSAKTAIQAEHPQDPVKTPTNPAKAEGLAEKVTKAPVTEISEVKTLSTPTKVASLDIKVKEEPITEIPPYSPSVPIGQSYIVPVTGFYCKLCSKFYNNEKAARESHCQTRSHYDKYKIAVLGTDTASSGPSTASTGAAGDDISDASSEDKKVLSTAPDVSPIGNSSVKGGRAGSQANRGQRGRRGRK